MNIIFLTMNVFTDIGMHNIYSDLMKEFIKHGHRPYIVTPRERNLNEKTEIINYDEYTLLKVQVGNTNNVSLIEKGISTITLSKKYYDAVKKNLGDIEFGLILYSTPPITLATPVKKLKKLFKCPTYLMLKDIFPQNAVDLKMFSKRSFIYKYFRQKEKELYTVSDWIGCMSPANADFILQHNLYLDEKKVEVCPNSIIPLNVQAELCKQKETRIKYGIPENAICYMYGGNLGKPQCVPFIIECLKEMEGEDDNFFVICGSGSDYFLLEDFIKINKQRNVKIINGLPKEDYDELLSACDVGLLFLDYRFTIPNYPSRMLSYMEQALPILACTDVNTDVGKIIEEAKIGWSCTSNSANSFKRICKKISMSKAIIMQYGKNARCYLENNYHAEKSYNIICKHLNN